MIDKTGGVNRSTGGNNMPEDIKERSGFSASEQVNSSLRPLIDTASNKRQTCLVDDASLTKGKKRKIDVRNGGGVSDKATKAITGTDKLCSAIFKKMAVHNPANVLTQHSKHKHVPRR